MVQTAEGALNEVSSILIRLRELSIQSSSDTVGDKERDFTDLEYQNLKQEIERISSTTEFNGKRLLAGGDATYDFQIGMIMVRNSYIAMLQAAQATIGYLPVWPWFQSLGLV